MAYQYKILLHFISLLYISSTFASVSVKNWQESSTKVCIRSLRGGSNSKLDDLIDEAVSSNRKIIVVTGGVLSGIGKGVTASSIGVLCRGLGFRVTALKIDPYLNVDAGTMSPFEHGEVFVLDDGGECDLDLGNYERFLSVSLTCDSNLTTGKVYQTVIEKERVGDYLGKTVQVVPHISDAIQEQILRVANTPVKSADDKYGSNKKNESPELCIVELGGTLGDIESMPFVEALRQLQENIGYKNMCFVHVSLVPVLGSPSEQKSKPTQHSVKQMRELGLAPDFLCCRGQELLHDSTKSKLSLFTSVPENAIISLHDVSNIYYVPLMMIEQNFPAMLAQRLRIHPKSHKPTDYSHAKRITKFKNHRLIENWTEIAKSVDEPESECVIAMVGKYLEQGDAYASVVKALTHAAIETKQRLRIEWINSSDLLTSEDTENCNEAAWEKLKICDGVLVPGGFGSRGLEGKIAAIRYAREQKIPFLGICLGMQAAVIEYRRSVLGKINSHSAEFKDDLVVGEDDVIIFMPEGDKERMGGTMRLGARETVLKKDSLAHILYGDISIMERHRHRYEVNPLMVEELEGAGLKFVGRNMDSETTGDERMEVIELDEDIHPYFVAAQFHPEFMSRPGKPSPPFLGLLKASKAFATSRSVAKQ